MRGKHDVVHFHERTIEWKRLKLKNIQSGSRETFCLQRFDQRFLLYDVTAGSVDQHRIWFHQNKSIAIDQMIASWV